MIWINLWVGIWAASAVPNATTGKDYFSQAIAIQDAAWALEDPKILRRYTVLLTEFHSQQFLFRAFAMRDLRGGENLWLHRKKTDRIIMNETQGLVENNLEALLNRAKKQFSGDINIRFAIAQFLYRGKCCLPSPTLKMSPDKILATFEEASKLGIESGASLYVLGLKDLPNDSKAQQAFQRLERAHSLNPHDPDILLALSSQAISIGEWSRAGQTAHMLFKLAPTANFKADALLNTARVFHHRKDYDRAITAARASLDIQPRLALAWNVGLDCLRRQNEASSYHGFIQSFLDGDLNDPALFRIYLDYVHLRGTHPFDKAYMVSYSAIKMPTVLAQMTQQTNLGNWHMQNRDYQQAINAYQEARQLADKLTGAPPNIAQIIDELIQLAKKGAPN